jgi:hypothetical protein
VSIAFDAIKWIVDTLLSKRKEEAARRTAKWNQVADYLDRLAKVIDSTVEDFKARRIPHGHYSLLYNLGSSFESVLRQVYDIDDPEDRSTVRKFRDALYNAVHLIEEGDEMVLEASYAPDSELGQTVSADLQSAAGEFRALAMTLRATA